MKPASATTAAEESRALADLAEGGDIGALVATLELMAAPDGPLEALADVLRAGVEQLVEADRVYGAAELARAAYLITEALEALALSALPYLRVIDGR